MTTLVIDTRVPAPRRIGGGLDGPAPTTTTGRRRNHRPPPTDRTTPGPATTRPPGIRPPAGHRTPAAAAEADTGAGHDDRTPLGHPEPAPPAIRPAVSPSPTATPAGQAVDELAAVRATLGDLVAVGDTVTTARLVQMVAVKLSSHWLHCAAAVNLPRGSLTVDEARGRCRAVLDALDPVERHAVLALVTHDVRAASR